MATDSCQCEFKTHCTLNLVHSTPSVSYISLKNSTVKITGVELLITAIVILGQAVLQ